MELCEYNLDRLIKTGPFKEDSLIVLLCQLGKSLMSFKLALATFLLLCPLAQAMKALRDQKIVHRDLKPQSILIKYNPRTGEMMVSIAN